MATSAATLSAGADISEPGFKLTNFAGNQLGLERGVYANGAITIGNEIDANDSRITLNLGGEGVTNLFVFLVAWYGLGRPFKIAGTDDTTADPAWPLLATLASFVAHIASGRPLDESIARHLHSRLAMAADECLKVFKYKTVDVQVDVLKVADPKPDHSRAVRLLLGQELNVANDKFTNSPKTVVLADQQASATFAKTMYVDDLVVFVLWWLRRTVEATPENALLVWAIQQFVLFADAVSFVRHGFSFGGYETPIDAHRGLTLPQIVDKFFPSTLKVGEQERCDTTRSTYAEDKAAKEAATKAIGEVEMATADAEKEEL